MNSLFYFLSDYSSPYLIHMSLLILRVGIGVLTIAHGYPKIVGGAAEWYQLGSIAMPPLGIHFWFTCWGFIAACTEFFGGILLTLGIGIRIASLFLACMMIVAFRFHMHKGDSFYVYGCALTLLIVYVAFFIMGNTASII